MGSHRQKKKKKAASKFAERRARNKAMRGHTLQQAVAKIAAVAGEPFAIALREHVNKVMPDH